MKQSDLANIPRRSAEEILTAVPGGVGYEGRVTIAVEAVMNEEWWRGYYAGRAEEREIIARGTAAAEKNDGN